MDNSSRARSRMRGARLGLFTGLSLTLMIASLSVYLAREFDRSALSEGDVRATQLARTGAHQLELTLFTVDGAIQRAATEIAANWPAPPARAFRAAELPDRVRAQLSFLDADGRMLEGALGPLPQPINLADRQYFAAHLGVRDVGVVITPPVISRVSGRWSIPMTRAVRSADGTLLGVVAALINADSLGDLLHNISMTSNDLLEIVSDDGKVWVRWPRSAASEGVSEARDLSAFVWRQASVPGWPLTLRAALSRGALIADNRPIVNFIFAASAVLILLIWVFAVFLFRQRFALVKQHDASKAMQRDLSAMLDAVPADIMELDENFKLKRANSRAAKTQLGRKGAEGFTVQEALAQAYDSRSREAVVPEERAAWLARQMDHIEKGGVFEERGRRGIWRRIHIDKMPGGGRIVLRLDISESKKREEQLAHIFDTEGAFIVLLDAEQRVIMGNRAFAATIGLTQAQIAGADYRNLGFGAIPEEAYKEWRSAGRLQPRQSVEYDADLCLFGKMHVARFTANPRENEDGELTHIVLIGVDDTERRESEIQLFDSARLANLGEMASGIAHEVNQPLAIMRLAAESASEELEAVGEGDASHETVEFVESKLKRISQQTERAANIIRDLRTVARKPANLNEPFDLADAVRVACNLTQEQMRLNRVELKLDLPSPGPVVQGEPGRLQQIIINLINNARDAILENTPENPTRYAGHIDVHVGTEGDRAFICVDDDGPGIPEVAFSRLFEPFFTTKPTGKGTGLGLSISYNIVHRMGGEITAENRPEGGARFRVTFKLYKQGQSIAAE